MSELGSHKGNGIRYIMHLSAPNGGVGQMLRHPDGNWVPHENYAHLKGEVGRLRKELEESQENYHLVNELAGKEMTRLKAEVERLKEGNDCLGQMHDKEMERSAYLREEFNRTTAWGRGLESDLSHARVEISFLKADVERLTDAITRGTAITPDAHPQP